jgi:integrase
MSRRSGQNGYIEEHGNAWYVRFWIDVPGQEKRKYERVRLCPTSGPGYMKTNERKRRARQIIAESGADSEELFRKVEAINLGVTFKQQAAWFLEHIQKRKPVKPKTVSSWTSHLVWINPLIGEMPLASVNNLALKELVCKMAEAKYSPKTMHNYLQIVKLVVASAVNEQGDQIYPRKWNHEFIDLPQVTNQRRPTFTADEVAAIVSEAKGQFRVLYSLLAGTGLRINEALALEVSDVSEGVVRVRQGVWNGILQTPKTFSGLREVDVHSSLAAVLKAYIGDRRTGFLFESLSGNPLSDSNIRNRSLHPILKAMGKEACGFHCFRRFRVTCLRKGRVPEDLIRFWIGHADKTVTDGYSKVKEDVSFRTVCAENVGIGFNLPSQILEEKSAVEPYSPNCTQSEGLASAV